MYSTGKDSLEIVILLRLCFRKGYSENLLVVQKNHSLKTVVN